MTTGRWLRNGLDIKLFHAIYRECPECGGIKQPVLIAESYWMLAQRDGEADRFAAS
jgi:hypothetical protein